MVSELVLWEKFLKSGSVDDYLAYARAERTDMNDDHERTYPERD